MSVPPAARFHPVRLSTVSGDPRRRRLPRFTLILAACALALSTATGAWAMWGGQGAGTAVGDTGTLLAPSSVTATAPLNSGTVSVGWATARLGTGQAATGYHVTRVRNSDGAIFAACGTSLASPTASVTCNDYAVTDGAYRYTVTALVGSWTAVSGSSPTVTVVNDTSPPVVAVTSISPTPNGSGYTNSTPVTVYLAATAGQGIASISYTVDSGPTVTVFSASAAVIVTGNGVHTVAYSAQDNPGTNSETGSVIVRIDTVAPAGPSAPSLTPSSDSGSSSTDRNTNVTSPVFTGITETGATVTLYNGASVVGSTVATTGGVYTVQSSVLTAGTKMMTVSSTDPAGNLSASSASTSITIDTTAPSAPGTPTLNAANDTGRSGTDGKTKVNTPTFTGTATAATRVTLFDGTTPIGSLTTTTTTYSITSSLLADGARTVTAKATDVAGNVSVASTGKAVTIDTVAPAAPSAPALTTASDTGSSTTDRITKTTIPIVTGTNETLAIVTLYDGATQKGTRTTTTATYSITSSTLANGPHTLTATATDVAGNLGIASGGTTVTIDTVAPAAPSTPVMTAATDTGISTTDGITKNRTPAFSGTAEAGIAIGLYNGVTLTGVSVTATGGAYTATAGTLSTGTFTLTARATDVAGNFASSSGTALTIDYTVPTVTLNQAAGQSDPTETSPVVYTVVFSQNVYGLTGSGVTRSGTALATTAVVTGSGTSYSVAVSGMVKTGTVIASVAANKAQDAAGNLNSASTFTDNTVSFTDTVAPAAASAPVLSAASDTGLSSADGITKTTTPVFTGTAEPGATIALFDGATATGSAVTTTAGGTYTATTGTLAAGSHTLTAKITDPSGNVGPASAGTTVLIDTSAPTVTVNQASGQADPAPATPIEFTVIFSENVSGLTGAGVALTGTGGATTAAITGTDTTYTVSVSGMAKTGTVIPKVAAAAALDVAGNLSLASTSTDSTVTYSDAAPPTVTITSLTSSTSPSQSATIAGTAGVGPGDATTVTVVLCSQSSFPCSAGNTLATLIPVVNAGTGAWSVTSGTVGATTALYVRATQSDLTGNIGVSPVTGPLAIP